MNPFTRSLEDAYAVDGVDDGWLAWPCGCSIKIRGDNRVRAVRCDEHEAEETRRLWQIARDAGKI